MSWVDYLYNKPTSYNNNSLLIYTVVCRLVFRALHDISCIIFVTSRGLHTICMILINSVLLA